MFPELVHIGPLTIRTYGVLVATGFFAALQYLRWCGRKQQLPENALFDIVLYAIVAGIAGARILYVLLNAGYYAAHPVEIFKVWEGGLVFYGGFAAGVIAVLLYVRAHAELPLGRLADCIAPALALGHMFGRIGCFFAGCCYGTVTRIPWAVSFSHPASLCTNPLPRHPVQLYEAAGILLLFVVLHYYHGRRQRPAGRTFVWYLLGYGVLRFGFEFLRGDDRGSMPGLLSPGQFISAGLAAVAAVLLLRRQAQ